MPYFAISAAAVMVAFCLIGVLSAGRVRSASDYAVAGQSAGMGSVAGVITGTLVAGASTVGTVQMAYEWGLSGWWFTMGSGIGCLLLGLRFASPMRRSGFSTLTEFMEKNYGYPTACLCMIGSILGTLISVATQFLAGKALLRALFPISQEAAAGILSVMILAFIFAGGLKSFGSVGNAKTVMLYLLLAVCCVRAATLGETPAKLWRDMPFDPWFNLFDNGAITGLGSGASLVAGILCTQIYMQAVFSATDERAARRGCALSAVLIPPLGLMGVWVGLALRNAGVQVEPAQALPYFLNTYFHPAVSGAFWAGLAITVVGGAAGLCLGVATNISLDIFPRFPRFPRFARIAEDERHVLILSRIAVFVTVAASALTALSMQGAYILQLSYIGMGLRAAGMTVPFVAAALRPGLLSPRCAFRSALAGLGVMLAAWGFLPRVEPLFAGLAASVIVAFLTHKKELAS